MTANDLWVIFCETGSVEAFLLYKSLYTEPDAPETETALTE